MNVLSGKNKITVTIILFILFYVLFAIYSDVDKIKKNFEQMDIDYIIPMISILTLSMFLRSLIQRFLLGRIDITLSVRQTFIVYLAGLSMLVTPGGSGQVIKSHFLERKFGHPVSKTLPLVIAERFYDLLAIILVVGITVVLSYSFVSLVIVLLSIILLVGLFAAIKHKRFLSFIKSVLCKIKFLDKVLSKNSGFDDSLQKFFHTSTILRASPLAVSAFLLEGLVIYLAFLTFNIDLKYLQTFQIYYTSLLYGTFSLIPGGVGVLEGSFVKLLMQKNFELSTITALIIFIRLTTTWFATALGFIATYFTLYKKNPS